MSDKKSSGTIDQMAAKYKTVDDLREYANAQFKQIIELSKKINELEKTNMELTAKLADAENLKEMLTGPTSMGEEFNVDDEEVICIIQLKFLKDKALVRELTMEEVKNVLSGFQPLKRAGLPEDVAQAALWLASDDSSFVNGHAMVVDGGVSNGRMWSQFFEETAPLASALGLG